MYGPDENRPRQVPDIWRRLRSNPQAMAGLVILATIVLVAAFAPLIAPHDPYETHDGEGIAPQTNKASPIGLRVGQNDYPEISYRP